MGFCKYVPPPMFSNEEMLDSMVHRLLEDTFDSNLTGISLTPAEWDKGIIYVYRFGEYVGFATKRIDKGHLKVDFHRYNEYGANG